MKDYLSEKEAAEYCCVCLKQFRQKAKEHRIFPAKFMGKKLYRKSDIQQAIESKFKVLNLPH